MSPRRMNFTMEELNHLITLTLKGLGLEWNRSLDEIALDAKDKLTMEVLMELSQEWTELQAEEED